MGVCRGVVFLADDNLRKSEHGEGSGFRVQTKPPPGAFPEKAFRGSSQGIYQATHACIEIPEKQSIGFVMHVSFPISVFGTRTVNSIGRPESFRFRRADRHLESRCRNNRRRPSFTAIRKATKQSSVVIAGTTENRISSATTRRNKRTAPDIFKPLEVNTSTARASNFLSLPTRSVVGRGGRFLSPITAV